MLALVAAFAMSQEPIKIGALFSQTGSFSSVDRPGLDGFQLAAARINARGGLLGRQIEVMAPDFRSNPALVPSLTKSMIQQGAVALGGFYDTDYAIPAGRVAEKMHIPMVTSGATLPTLPDMIGQWFFMACYGDDDQARAGAWFAKKGLDAKTAVVIVDDTSTYTRALAKFFTAEYKRLGGTILQTVKYADHDTAATVVPKLKAKPEILYVASLPDHAGPFAKTLRASSYNQPILSGDGFDTPDLIRIGGKAANNVFFTTHYAPSSKAENVQDFKRAYFDLFGTYPESAAVALAYDTMNLIANAIDRAGSTEPAKVRYALATTKDFDEITGRISYAPGKRKPKKTVFVLGVRDGKKELVKTVAP